MTKKSDAAKKSGKAQIILSSDSEIEIVEPPSAPSPRRLRRKPVDDAPYQESEEDESPAPPSPPSQRKRILRKRGDDAPYQQSEAGEPPAPPSPPSQRKRAHRKKADKTRDENQESEEDEPQQKRKRLAPAEPLSPSSFMNILRELQDKKMAVLERKEQANAKELELVKEQKNLVEAQIKLRESQRADNEAAEAKAAREKEEKAAEALAAQATETPVRNAAAAASLPTPVSAAAATPAPAPAPAYNPDIARQLFSVLLGSMQPAS